MASAQNKPNDVPYRTSKIENLFTESPILFVSHMISRVIN